MMAYYMSKQHTETFMRWADGERPTPTKDLKPPWARAECGLCHHVITYESYHVYNQDELNRLINRAINQHMRVHYDGPMAGGGR